MKAIHLILAAVILLGAGACQKTNKDFSVEKNGDIWFRNSGIELKFDKQMYCQVYEKSGATTFTPESREESTERPSHFIVMDGEELRDFSVDYENIAVESIQTAFGNGNKMVLSGTALCQDGTPISKTMEIELYDNYPDVAVVAVSYKNMGSSPKLIEMEYSMHFQLDASMVNPDAKAYDFWSFQGSSLAWGLDYIIKIDEGFSQENWMGVQADTKTGGGVPLMDLWNQNSGLAIAHLETRPQMVSFPVKVEADHRVSLSMAKQANQSLAPGKSYRSLKTAVMVHSGDFFDPLSTYSSLMAKLGQEQKKPSEEAHEAIWCGWGYLTDFSLDDIYGTLPKLKELGIKWVVIDDRWWDKYGDWNIRDFTFPGGGKTDKGICGFASQPGILCKNMVGAHPCPAGKNAFLGWFGGSR